MKRGANRGMPPGPVNTRCCVCGRELHRTPTKLRQVANVTCGWACREALTALRRAAKVLHTHCGQCGKLLKHVDGTGRFHAAKRFCDHVCAGTWAARNPEPRRRWREAMEKNVMGGWRRQRPWEFSRRACLGLVDDFAMPAEAFD